MKTYRPGNVPDNPAALPGFLRAETLSLTQAAQRAEPFLLLQVLYAEPARILDGMLVEAAAPWNPGSGDGLYIRRAGAWVFIG